MLASAQMKRIILLSIVGLVACGGSSPEPTKPAAGSSPTVESSTEVVADAPGEPAGEAPKKKKTNDAGEFAVKDSDESGRPTRQSSRPRRPRRRCDSS